MLVLYHATVFQTRDKTSVLFYIVEDSEFLQKKTATVCLGANASLTPKFTPYGFLQFYIVLYRNSGKRGMEPTVLYAISHGFMGSPKFESLPLRQIPEPYGSGIFSFLTKMISVFLIAWRNVFNEFGNAAMHHSKFYNS